jgi:SAM-dependent methyltransferase
MIEAIALVTEHLSKQPLQPWLIERCRQAGIALKVYTVSPQANNLGDYKPLFRSCQNVITWGYKMPHEWMAREGRNVLYIENSLIHQRSGLFVDHGGYFADSNLCKKATWTQDHSVVDVVSVAQECFGWKFLGGGDPEGPILVSLQQPRDASVRYYFPLGEGCENKVHAALRLLQEHLPRCRKVLIRPHPRERQNFDNGGIWRDDWTLDVEGSFAERLPQCSALITVNSTCATEAALLGMPTATLGTGAFSGSGITLECWDNPKRLEELPAWRPDPDACRRYLQAVRGQHFLPYDGVNAASAELEGWIQTALIRAGGAGPTFAGGEQAKYRAIYSNGTHARYGHSNHGARSLKMLMKWKPRSVLDVGCGWNEFAATARKHLAVTRVVGVDFACPGADVVAAATRLPFADKEFDVVTSFDMLEHLPPDEVDAALAEMARVSERFVVSISYRQSRQTWKGEPLHQTVKNEEWWVTRLMGAGALGIGKESVYITGRWGRPLRFKTNSSVVLVGNGPSVLRSPLGAVIDSFDEVIRFNEFETKGFEKHVGSKTTFWCGLRKLADGPMRHPNAIFTEEFDAPTKFKECYFIPSWIYRRTYHEIRERSMWSSGFETDGGLLRMTSGLLLARYLLEVVRVKHVHLAGFDHFSKVHSSQHHYWMPGRFKPPEQHNGELEKTMFDELRKAGRVIYL